MATSPVCQPDRHGGSGCALTPATPPCVRVCTRRFEMINRNLLVRISLVSASSLLLPLLSSSHVVVARIPCRSEEHTSELQSRLHLVCRLLLEKKKKIKKANTYM